jgi:hypothetical protein
MSCYTGDPILKEYLILDHDMHRDQAQSTFLLEDNEWDSLDKKLIYQLRFFAKNQNLQRRHTRRSNQQNTIRIFRILPHHPQNARTI